MPMKRFLLLSIAAIYLLSCTGMAVNSFYCCGKLKSVSLSEISLKHVKNDGCCNTTSQIFKIKDQHLSSAVTSLYAPLAAIIPSNYFFGLDLPTFQQPIQHSQNYSPPGNFAVAIHELNCTYRI